MGVANAQPKVTPVLPVDQATWSQLAVWQREHFNKLVFTTGWQDSLHVDQAKWRAMTPEAKSKLTLQEVRNESSRRLRKEALHWFAEEQAWRTDPAQATKSDKQQLVDAVMTWNERYPLATADAGVDKIRKDLEQRAAFYQQELNYRGAHPRQEAASDTVTRIRNSGAANPAGDAAALDRLYDKSGATATPGVKPGTVAGVNGAKTPPVAVPQQGAKIDGEVPPTLRWKYVHTEPKGLSQERMNWRKKVDANALEEKFVRYIVNSLDAPIERELMANAARQQADLEKETQNRIRVNEQAIADTRGDLAKPGLSAADRQFLKEELGRLQKNLTALRAFSTEMVITMGDLNGGVAAETYLEGEPGPDGKQRMRMILNRNLAFPGDVKLDNSKDGTRKIMAHEMTHVGDFYALALDRGPSLRMQEPRGYLNAAISYKQEGEPKGRLPEYYGARPYRELMADPSAWMFRQMNDFVGDGSLTSANQIWNTLSADDYSDPRRALDWRLQYIYRYAVSAPSRDGRPRADQLKAIAAAFDISREQADLLVKTDADKSISEREKSVRFAKAAASDRRSAHWVENVRNTPKAQVEAAAREEKDFFKKLRPLF